MGSAYSEEKTSTQGERQRVPVGRLALYRVPGQYRNCDSQSGYLSQRQINKDDAPGQDMETEIDVDTCKHQAGQKRHPQKFNHKSFNMRPLRPVKVV
jgi:hypothetical protein